jgi:hypothetical protein
VSIYRQSVNEYIRACEALLKSSDLSDHEQQVVEDTTRRMSEEMVPPDSSWTPPGDESGH